MAESEEHRQTQSRAKRKLIEVMAGGADKGNDGGAAEDEEEAEEQEEREIQELELEIKAMAERILESRRTMPDHVAQALSSRLLAHRPPLPFSLPPPEQFPEREDAPIRGADQEMLEKLRIFHEKTLKNVAAMPIILKRINDCIARIDKLEEYSVDIHPVFKRR